MKSNKDSLSRIFLIDDHPIVIQGVGQLLSEHSCLICGTSNGSSDLNLNQLNTKKVDLVILDLSLKGESGLKILVELTRMEIPVLIYSMHEDPETIELAFDTGATAYVSKREKDEVLVAGVCAALAGNNFIGPAAAQCLASNLVCKATAKMKPGLSQRENAILILLSEGETKGDIADKLTISIRTVETYCYRIMEKIGINGMSDLRKFAIKNFNIAGPDH